MGRLDRLPYCLHRVFFYTPDRPAHLHILLPTLTTIRKTGALGRNFMVTCNERVHAKGEGLRVAQTLFVARFFHTTPYG